MKQWIYERGAVIGSFDLVQKGLYWEFSCEIQHGKDKLRRLYAVCGFSSHYLGIPDLEGKLKKMLSQKLLPEGATCLISSERERDRWCPWRGTLDGVNVEDGLLCREDDGLRLSLSAEEALQFPAWSGEFIEENDHNHVRMLVQLTSDGRLPVKEIKNRRETNEKDENFVGFIDPQLPFDPDSGAGECTGDKIQGGEVNRSDL